MNDAVFKDMSRSSRCFINTVWPAIAGLCGGGELRPVELSSDDMAEQLDMLAGIDAWQIVKDTGIRGLAVRVQWCPESYETFTVRYERRNGAKTEYAKRVEAMVDDRRGWLFPHLTCQAYLTEREIMLSVAVVRTKDLYLWLDIQPSGWWKPIWNKDGSSSFQPVKWDDLLRDNVQVRILRGALCQSVSFPPT